MFKRRIQRILALGTGLVLAHSVGLHASFQDRGWGVRAQGMGRAFVALADDGSAPFWNPAGAARLKNGEASLMWERTLPQLDGITVGSGFLSLVAPTRWGAFGFSLTDFDVSGIVQENVGLLTYARNFGPQFSGGVNLRYLRHNYTIGENPEFAADSAFANGTGKSAFTTDLGALYSPVPWLSLGLAGRNLSEPNVGLNGDDKVPAEYQFGAAWLANQRLTVEMDGSYRDQDSDVGRRNFLMGAQYNLLEDMVVGRLGYNFNEFTGGFSFHPWSGNSLSLRLDYAFILNLQDGDAGLGHKVGLSFLFGGIEPRRSPSRAAALETAPQAQSEPSGTFSNKETAPKPATGPLPPPRINTIVFFFQHNNTTITEAGIVTSDVQDELAHSGLFNLMDRHPAERIAPVRSDEPLEQFGKRAAAAGRAMHVQQVVVGRLTRVGAKYYIRVKVLDSGSGRMTASEAVYAPAKDKIHAAAVDVARRCVDSLLLK